MSGAEVSLVQGVFDSNWVAPLGPHVDAFEHEFAQAVGARHAVALSSGTAALHLALLLAGVRQDDDVIVSSLTFSASVNPIAYLGARPVFIDSEASSWNMDPSLLEQALEDGARKGRRTAAVVAVHLYGQSADIDAITKICARYDVPLIEDAAEALGATYKGKHPGTFGQSGIFSFNGNKIITTSGGGMLVSEDPATIAHARKLATQAREPAAHYEHREIGYNYRLSNVLAAIGRAQLGVLHDRVNARRRVFEAYREGLGGLPGMKFQREMEWGRHNRWLTCVLIEAGQFGADREAVRLALEAENIEARPLWKPMHQQPVFAGCPTFGGDVADRLFQTGLCLPSGSAMTASDIQRVCETIRTVARQHA